MKIKLTYFKDTGKWYADGECEIPDDVPYHLIKTNILHMSPLPGLYARWAGYILVETCLGPDDDPLNTIVPILILPEGQR